MQSLTRRSVVLGLVAFAVACATPPPPAPPLKIGSLIAAATLLDQNEVPHAIDESVRIVLFAREMEGGALIRALLEEEGPDYLTNTRALYVADISGMPSLIANLVAIPKMQDERLYPTLLDRDGITTAPFPSEVGHATVIGLENLRVTAVDHRVSVAGIREAIAEIITGP
jgi:hypothetical protein